MTDGNTDNIQEVKQFSKLSLHELITLRAVYFNRISQINRQIRKLNKDEDIGQICIDMMNRYGHCEKVFQEDATLIHQKYRKDIDWDSTHSKYPNEAFALCIVSDIYSKYNIEFNPHEYVEDYGLDGTQFQRLYIRLKDWTKKHYWR